MTVHMQSFAEARNFPLLYLQVQNYLVCEGLLEESRNPPPAYNRLWNVHDCIPKKVKVVWLDKYSSISLCAPWQALGIGAEKNRHKLCMALIMMCEKLNHVAHSAGTCAE